jgi:EAL domain-containing protein (putative c-di-GMP-specific phosphodiesterase class I)
VALIIDIAKNLRIPVVAEGVETEEQMKLLKDLGCEVVQGYYFSRPLHASDFGTSIIQKQKQE